MGTRNVTEMETYTGRFVDLLDPQPEQICLTDIAVGLANICRFGGQVNRFYSVAEHSVRASELCTHYPLAALLHDAHEAYTNDITSPVKRTLEAVAPFAVQDLQKRLDIAIAAKFGLHYMDFTLPQVKEADEYMLYREAAGLKHSHGVGAHWGNLQEYEPLAAYGWSPAEAERRFIERYERLA